MSRWHRHDISNLIRRNRLWWPRVIFFGLVLPSVQTLVFRIMRELGPPNELQGHTIHLTFSEFFRAYLGAPGKFSEISHHPRWDLSLSNLLFLRVYNGRNGSLHSPPVTCSAGNFMENSRIILTLPRVFSLIYFFNVRKSASHLLFWKMDSTSPMHMSENAKLIGATDPSFWRVRRVLDPLPKWQWTVFLPLHFSQNLEHPSHVKNASVFYQIISIFLDSARYCTWTNVSLCSRWW